MSTLDSVLIIEDTETDRYIVSRLVRRAWPEARIWEAADGQEAIELLETLGDVGPELIFLDINMPRMNGHEFLERYYARLERQAPVVLMLTSSDSPEDRERVSRFACVRDYLVKPISREQVEALPGLPGEMTRAA